MPGTAKKIAVAFTMLVFIGVILPAIIAMHSYCCVFCWMYTTCNCRKPEKTAPAPPAAVVEGAPRLPDLGGEVRAVGGNGITEGLWAKMRAFRSNDPRIEGYLAWLRDAMLMQANASAYLEVGRFFIVKVSDALKSLAGGGYVPIRAYRKYENLCPPYYCNYYLGLNLAKNQTILCTGKTKSGKIACAGCMIPPPVDGVVRVGAIQLPFGATIVVTAYQAGDGIVAVVHGTITNRTAWQELVARTVAFGGYPSPLMYGWGAWNASSWVLTGRGPRTVKYETYWALLRAVLGWHGSYLEVSGRMFPVRSVVVLLEVPVHLLVVDGARKYVASLEPAYWMLLGEPAFALALRLAYGPGTDSLSIYRAEVPALSKALAGAWGTANLLHGAQPLEPGFPATPMMVGVGPAKPGPLSRAQMLALLASDVFGGASMLAQSKKGVSLALLCPSSAFGNVPFGTPLPLDVDRDGKEDRGVLMAGDSLPPRNGGLEYAVFPPLAWHPSSLPRYGYALFWAGIPQALMRLPGWLQMPWLAKLARAFDWTSLEKEAKDAFARTYYAWDGIHAPIPVADYISTVKGSPAVKAWTFPMPPSFQQALGTALPDIPAIRAGTTPALPVPAKAVSATVTAKKIGEREYLGSAEAGNTNITVLVFWNASASKWFVKAWANSTLAYAGALPAVKHETTVWFGWGGEGYKVTVLLPVPEGRQP